MPVITGQLSIVGTSQSEYGTEGRLVVFLDGLTTGDGIHAIWHS
ncbi:MAG: hypothetical protein R2710_00045 [Acidimicrobiales bacterium]